MSDSEVSQQGQCFRYDVIVIGGGIAGLSYILALLRLRPNVRIALICKQGLHESNSYYAQGGIAAVSGPGDSIAQHIADTIASGDGLCEEQLVAQMIAEGPETIQFLNDQGVLFDQARGFQLGKEGGHSQRRIYTHGDRTGAAVMNALIGVVRRQPQVTILEYHTAVNLITQEQHSIPKKSAVIGAYILAEKEAVIHVFLANILILATGGAGILLILRWRQAMASPWLIERAPE